MNRPMLIGYDAKRIVCNGTGLGSYGRTLVNDIAADKHIHLHLYAPDRGRDDLRGQIRLADNVDFHFMTPSRMPFSRAFWRSRGIVGDLRRDGIQLYHGLSGELPIGIHRSGIRSIVTIHDLIFLRHPEFYHWADAKIYAWKFQQALREADHIIAISNCTKRDIVELGEIDERDVTVVYQSCAPRFSRHDCDGPDRLSVLPQAGRYVLSVGSIEARKNILLAVKALHWLPDDLSLVLVGRHTSYCDQVAEYAKAHGLAHRLHILHGVTDGQLPSLYAHAEAFVYPSVYEGFGIPIIEAISCGLPVVACKGSCLEEAGGPDSLYVDTSDAQGLAHALRCSLKGAEGREQRISRSQHYIRRFQGSSVAGQVVQLYQEILKR